MIRSILPLALLMGLVAPALGQPAQSGRAPALLLHGNYCGPGNNAPASPVDALDAACARHDACTPDGALPSRACNLRLQAEAGRVADDPRQPLDLRILAGFVASAAAMLPSGEYGTIRPAAARIGAGAAGQAMALGAE